MTGFVYLCLTVQGAEARGHLEAPDEITARRQLKELGLKVLSIGEGQLGEGGVLAAFRKISRGISRFRSVKNNDKVLFFRQMQLMLKAGHTLLEALSAASRLAPGARLADIIDRVAVGIQRGNSLSVSCSGERELFNRLALKLIEAGEASGELGAVFERLATLIERRAEVRRQLVTALVYPGFVLLAAIGVILFLVLSVVPRFATFLNGRGKAIPWAAQTMLDIADWLARWGWLIGVTIVGIIVGVPLLRRIAPTKRFIDKVALKLPVIGGTLVAAAMAQATWIFGILIRSGLTVLESLRICREVVGNAVFSGAFAYAAEQVLTGRSLAVALDQPALPRLVQHMAAVGEKSGQVDSVMESLGAHYQKVLDARVKLLASMIEPALTVLIGGIVGFVYYAFFQAMLAVSTGG
ncbi:MAG: type II secretion system F family protein [Zoogloeaceae bacterium]|jgi:type IV pilus assembly protein PilC|nr:type II secretion system F family protein [Zoogloeaceae bacterium]